MTAKPVIIYSPDAYDTGPLTTFLSADAARQGYTIKGECRHEGLVLIVRPKAPDIRSREDVQ